MSPSVMGMFNSFRKTFLYFWNQESPYSGNTYIGFNDFRYVLSYKSKLSVRFMYNSPCISYPSI